MSGQVAAAWVCQLVLASALRRAEPSEEIPACEATEVVFRADWSGYILYQFETSTPEMDLHH